MLCRHMVTVYTDFAFLKICLNLIVGLRLFLNMNKIQVDFAEDTIFRSGKGKSVNVYSDPVPDVIHFN